MIRPPRNRENTAVHSSMSRRPAPLSDSTNPVTANSGSAGTCEPMSITYASSGTVSSTPLEANISSAMPPSTAKMGTPDTAETIMTINSGTHSDRTVPLTVSARSRSGASSAGSPEPISQESSMIRLTSGWSAKTVPSTPPSTAAAIPADPERSCSFGRAEATAVRSAMSPKPIGRIASTARLGSTPTRA